MGKYSFSLVEIFDDGVEEILGISTDVSLSVISERVSNGRELILS